MGAPLTIAPDMDQAIADFRELVGLSARFGFDLRGCLERLADFGTPTFATDVDHVAATSAGHAIARYQLAERLQGVLEALRAQNVEGDGIKNIVAQDAPPFKAEITPKMIEAGLNAYYSQGTLIEDADNREKREMFTAIFYAMESCRRQRAE